MLTVVYSFLNYDLLLTEKRSNTSEIRLSGSITFIKHHHCVPQYLLSSLIVPTFDVLVILLTFFVPQKSFRTTEATEVLRVQIV